jgi:hypothetical protein
MNLQMAALLSLSKTDRAKESLSSDRWCRHAKSPGNLNL